MTSDDTILCNMRAANKIANRMSGKCPHFNDDLRQECMLALVKASQSFDPDRGVKFITHAWTRVTYAGKSFLRNAGRQKERYWQCGNHDTEIADHRSNEHHKQAIADNARDAVAVLLSCLTECEATLIERLYGLNGRKREPMREIVKECGIIRHKVEYVRKKAIKKMRKLAESQGFNI